MSRLGLSMLAHVQHTHARMRGVKEYKALHKAKYPRNAFDVKQSDRMRALCL